MNYDPITASPAGSKLLIDGNEKSACNGRDLHTRECRGGYCSIGKEGECIIYYTIAGMIVGHVDKTSQDH